MEILSAILPLHLLALAALVTLIAGTVKGAVGFAMPMIMISGLAAFMPVELALAALIVPTLISNGIQALRQGPEAAVQSIKRFRVFLMVGFIFLVASAQLVVRLPQEVLFLAIGLPIVIFVGIQIIGWSPHVAEAHRAKTEVWVGAIAGSIGGLSGVWGPPTVAYLTAIETPKGEQIRVQGVVYGLGAVALFGAHLNSGVLRLATMPLSLAMVPPALVGLWLGFQVHDRMDQRLFRKATLIVLFVAGLNLVRRALFN